MSSSSPLPIVSSCPDDRPPSVLSVASSSSMASTSGVSLTRRPRTRARSKTVTGSGQPRPADSELDSLLLPPRPVITTTSSRSLTSDSAAGEVTLVPQPSPMPPKQSKAAMQASTLASIETSYNTAFSAFSRDPELTPNARDSFSTQKSSTSSSFYPPSTSTVSAPESPASPRTAAQEDSQQPNISLLTEDAVEEMQDYDGDDVAYRLRLLVNNNYFLPPAHAKPSPEDFAASMSAKKSQKHSTPTFLDIFRVGKSKPKPTTPVSPNFPNGPMLRTTSDSIAAPFALSKPTRSPQAPYLSVHPMNGNVDRGRVVVVRERMDNIAVAAKQAEKEIKTRNARRDLTSDKTREQQPPPQLRDGDIIDPTDAVDIPLPASNYPFAVQASALHGLGVQESVGAAVLADRLPPHSPGSPGMSVSYETDDWRKALLREAVHHSLDNTPDESMFSYVPGTSTPILASPRVNGELSRSTTPGTRAQRLQQRIAEPPTSLEISEPLQDETQINKKDPIHKSEQSQASTSKSTHQFLTAPGSNDSRRSSFLPARAVTPVANPTPLTPAPRKQIFNHSGLSASHADLHQPSSTELDPSISPKSRLRRSMSTPMLSESYESMRQQFVMTPPPPPIPATRRSSQMTQLTLQSQYYEAGREMPSRTSEFSSISHFDDCDGRIVRGSPRLSALGNRPSFSSYSQASLSPTTSAFQDALNHPGSRSSTSSIHRSSFDEPTEPETRTRSSIASPPPRPSTSISHNALRPPPRSSSFHYPLTTLGRNIAGSEPRIEITNASSARGALAQYSVAPHASSSSASSSTRRRDSTPVRPLRLEIPTANSEVSIHSPAPSSPTSFFDTLQAQRNAMDDLESSDDESDGDGGEEEEDTDDVTQKRPLPSSSSQTYTSPPPFILDPRARANSTVSISPIKPRTMMRLGNFSAPYVGRGQMERMRAVPLPLPIGVADSRKALGYTPARAQFFSEKKSEMGHHVGELGTTLFVQAQAQAQSQNLGSVAECPGPSIPSGMVGTSTFTSTGPPAAEKRRPATASQASQILPTFGVGPGGPSSPTFVSFLPQQHSVGDRRPEAVRRLDGMLVEHMEAEKDRIRKIAGALKSSSQVHLPDSVTAATSGEADEVAPGSTGSSQEKI